MRFDQKWIGLRLGKNGEREEFIATVPGNIQLDYANYAKFEDISYADIHGLRIEARQKLEKIKPENLGQASRISGVSPADITVLMIYLNMNER